MPNVVFVDIGGTAADTLGTMLVLKQVYYPGLVQLMGHAETAMPKYFAELGRNFGLNILAHLQKPLSASAIRKIVDEHSLGGKPIHRTEVNLHDAIDRKWVEFWYQPKIDFATRKAVGAELFARVNHPELGVLGPQAFMPDADAKSLGELAGMAIVNALETGSRFNQLGVSVRLAININIDTLAQLSVPHLVTQYRKRSDTWGGLILDISEQQLYRNAALLHTLAPPLAEAGVDFALDDFGRGNCSMAELKHIRFAEVKIDRHFTRNCAADSGNESICKTIVDMAHNFHSHAVAIGVESANEATMLKNMGCDIGQGYYFNAPLPEAKFFSLLCART